MYHKNVTSLCLGDIIKFSKLFNKAFVSLKFQEANVPIVPTIKKGSKNFFIRFARYCLYSFQLLTPLYEYRIKKPEMNIKSGMWNV